MDANERRLRVTREATEWWVTLQDRSSRAERERFVDWLRESPLHVAEILRTAQLHGALDQFERWMNVPTDGPSTEGRTVVALAAHRDPPKGDTPEACTRSRTLRHLLPIAAVFVIALGVAVAVLIHSEGQIIQTDRGERREIALADGSVVDVDPETRLRIQYDQSRRVIHLERGRALFHVAKDPSRPFTVEAAGTLVRALGTSFGV